MNPFKSIRFALLFLLLAPLMILVGCGNDTADEDLPSIPESVYVYDETGILKNETKQHIITENENLQSQTGTTIAVICVRSTKNTPISEYARQLFLSWEIGTSPDQTGVLLLVNPREGGYWCLPSRELEETLSVQVLEKLLLQSMEPYLASENYDEGIRITFDSLAAVLRTSASADPDHSEETPEKEVTYRRSNSAVLGWVIIAVLLALLVLHFVLALDRTPRWQKRRTVHPHYRYRSRSRRTSGTLPNPVRRPAAPPPGRPHRNRTSAPASRSGHYPYTTNRR